MNKNKTINSSVVLEQQPRKKNTSWMDSSFRIVIRTIKNETKFKQIKL